MVRTTTTIGPKVFTSLQAGRAIAALIVVLSHCAFTMAEPKYWNHSWIRYFYFGHSGVEIFFVLSGIVILYAHKDDVGKASRLTSYIWKRVKRIYPIYWVALCINLAVFFLVPTFGRGFERQPLVIFQSFLLVHLATTNTVLAVAWTLYHEIMFYALFAVMIASRKWGTALLSLWMLASVYTLIWSPANLVLAEYFSPLHLLFGFGMGVVFFMRRYTIPGVPLAVVGTAGFVACSIYDNLTQTNLHPVNIGYGVSATLVLCGCMCLEREGKFQIPPTLKLLGDASYSIYLIHLAAVSILAKVLFAVWKQVHVPLFFPFTIMAVGSITVGVAFHRYVEKPLLRWLNGWKSVTPERKPVKSSRPPIDQISVRKIRASR